MWTLLHPYLNINGSFYLCPADRGPNNFALLTKLFTSAGIRTNDLPFPNSYWYGLAFFTQGNRFASLTPRQRSVSDVRYPSQKLIMACQALDPKDKGQINADYAVPQAHGKGRFATLFVDGHSSLVWYPLEWGNSPHTTRVFHPDPDAPEGWGIGSLAWMDVP